MKSRRERIKNIKRRLARADIIRRGKEFYKFCENQEKGEKTNG